MKDDPILRLAEALNVHMVADVLDNPKGLPAGYILASKASYPDGKGPFGQELGYTHSVQFLNQQTGDMPRFTGSSWEEAIEKGVLALRNKFN